MKIIQIFVFWLAFIFVLQAQTENQRRIFSAMEDELQRNIESLSIEGLERPFFIQYSLKRGNLFQVQATMGALTGANEFPVSVASAQVLVGNYQLANINLVNTDYRTSGRSDTAPIDDNYNEIRRRFWLLTDNSYKTAIEEYGNKLTSVRQLNLPQEVIDLPDFTQLPAATYYGIDREMTYNRSHWEKIARDCSAVFIKYPDIFGSNVGVEIYSGEIFSVNSENTKLLHTTKLITIAVNAYTKLEDGEEISDRLSYYGLSEGDLPHIDQLLKDVEAMAENILALANAPRMENSYTGPVMLQGPVLASNLATELLAARTGLVAFRTPLRSGGVERLLEDRMNLRILSTDITVKAEPRLKTHNGQILIGAYEVDSEGVTPESQLTLIENGMLRALMNDRVPTKRISAPTGNRIYAYQPQGIATRVSPGVLSITSSNGLSQDSLKTLLLEAARIEGLNYAYIIRALPAGRLAALYKVSVDDGSEQMVRASATQRIDMAKLKRALGTAQESSVTNMIAGGVPISIIYPNAMVIEEVDIEKRNFQNTTKLPTVSNPLRTELTPRTR